MAVLKRVPERLLRSSFFWFGYTGTLGSSRYLLYFLMWYPFIKMRVKHDLLSHSKLWLACVVSQLWHAHNSRGFWVFVSSTTFGHKSCICSTIYSFRLFLELAHIVIYIIIRTWIQGVAANEHQDWMKCQENRDRRKCQPNQGIRYRDIALINLVNCKRIKKGTCIIDCI